MMATTFLLTSLIGFTAAAPITNRQLNSCQIPVSTNISVVADSPDGLVEWAAFPTEAGSRLVANPIGEDGRFKLIPASDDVWNIVNIVSSSNPELLVTLQQPQTTLSLAKATPSNNRQLWQINCESPTSTDSKFTISSLDNGGKLCVKVDGINPAPLYVVPCNRDPTVFDLLPRYPS